MAASICKHVSKSFLAKSPLHHVLKSPYSTTYKRKPSRSPAIQKDVAQTQMLVRMRDIHKARQEEAAHSVIIHSHVSVQHVLDVCSRYGKVNDIFFFRGFYRHESMLVVFDRTQSVQHLLGETGHVTSYQHTPVQTRFLLLNKLLKSTPKKRHNTKFHHESSLSEEELITKLSNCKQLSQQMVTLRDCLKLSETGIRLRYLICQVIKESMQSIVKGVDVLPFGSTVNGFGRKDADVDMIMHFPDQTEVQHQGNGLEFMFKVGLDDKRKETQQNLDTVRGVLKHFLPQFHEVTSILKARIPIIRFRNAITCLQCDLSMCNESAIHMSELLHVFSKVDASVQPLIFTIRHWAHKCEITRSDMPGTAFTNFMLTVFVVFFLQTRPAPILPTLDTLRHLAGAEEVKQIGGIDCTFTSDWRKVPKHNNQETLGDLLREFFAFYHNFNFEDNAISLIRGEIFGKPATTEMEREVNGEAAMATGDAEEGRGSAEDATPEAQVRSINHCYIENPLEQELNVSRNVSKDRVAHFQEECRKALEILQQPGPSLLTLFNESHRTVDINIASVFENDR